MKQRCIFIFKYVYLISLFASFCDTTKCYAQQNDLIVKAQELVFSNPDESIKITEHILRTAEDPQEKATLNLLIAKSFLVKGDFVEAISYAFDDVNYSGEVSIDTQTEHHILKAKILRTLYLDKQSKDYLLKANDLSKVSIGDSINSKHGLIALERINMHVDRRENDEAIIAINNAENKFRKFFEANLVEKRNLYLAKVRALSNLSEIDSASIYLNRIMNLDDTTLKKDLYQKAIIFNELARLNLSKREFNDCERNLFIASRFAEIINNSSLLMRINKNLAINYLASNRKNQHKVYNDKFLALNNQVELQEQEAVNSLYSILASQDQAFLAKEEQKFEYYQYFLLVGLCIVCFLGVFIVSKSEGRKKRLKEIINYIEVTKNNYLQKKPSKKVITKRIEIPKETERTILAKLKRFESSNKFLNKEMSLAVLAGQFETNTKYLSGVINKHYNDNFNTFINKLRVNYIIDKLKNDSNYINYKISFLAEESGYSSHSSFATVFKSVVGMSPVTFIKLIQEERKEQKLKGAD